MAEGTALFHCLLPRLDTPELPSLHIQWVERESNWPGLSQSDTHIWDHGHGKCDAKAQNHKITGRDISARIRPVTPIAKLIILLLTAKIPSLASLTPFSGLFNILPVTSLLLKWVRMKKTEPGWVCVVCSQYALIGTLPTKCLWKTSISKDIRK